VGDSFEETALESVLAGLGVGSLVVAGAQTDECIRSTLHGAIARGYDAMLVSDAHTTEDLSQWGRRAGVGCRAHQPVLGQPSGAGADGGDRDCRGGGLRRYAVMRRADRPRGGRRAAARAGGRGGSAVRRLEWGRVRLVSRR